MEPKKLPAIAPAIGINKRFCWLRLRGRLAQERGVAILEMALVTPLLLVLLAGVIEIGRYAELSIVVANAARAGVQYGAQNLIAAGDTNGITAAAVNDSQGVLTASADNVCVAVWNCNPFEVTNATSNCQNGGSPACASSSQSQAKVYVQVNTVGTFRPLFGAIAGLPALVNVKGMAEMQVAQ